MGFGRKTGDRRLTRVTYEVQRDRASATNALVSGLEFLYTYKDDKGEAAQFSNVITQNRLKVASSVFRIHAQGTARDGKISRVVEGVVRRGTGVGPSRPVSLLSLA